MGVPKFYRWVSERYPCLSETVKEFQIPEFDNLYLDMNGIIHVCSHPEDDNPHFRITEEKIFADIMHYLEFLFRMIKPRKVFFMAVDGVAPRAKMNQQRGRRFRSAREAEDLEQKARLKGETLPSEKRFDSNCITPGTPFMVKLQEQLKYFVVRKISTDPLWHGVRVYLSGHETPGEGEHKIMDFIRAERSQPGYDTNTRHCLNGLDADLMMLGLASHEPHFSLLREEVKFGGRKDRGKRPATPEETTFHLLHLSLFREYLDFEFSPLKDKLTTFKYDLEGIIDDWVLMGFLVGNDFIPHLPNLHINHDALPLLWQTYIDILPSCGGYLNEGGYLNLERFEKYLSKLSEFDLTTFSEQAGDLKWLAGKKGQSSAEKEEMLSAARKFKKNMKKMENQFAALNDMSEDQEDFMGAGAEFMDESPEEISDDFTVSDEDSEDTLDDEFRHHKRHYYMTKLDYEKVTPEVLQYQAECYVRGIQWILLYYYEGVPSWSWFYPHHYAPYMSDVKNFKNMVLNFDLATPFLPFEQLMAVLPAASKEFLPEAFQSLMTMDSSPVIDFYPPEFETDLNGKQQDWEAVVLIPFIDENRLLSAMRSAESRMTEEEKSRNIHGPHCLFEYTLDPGPVYPSSLPGIFPDIAFNHSRLTLVPKEAFWLKSHLIKKHILEGAKLDVYFPGFPTLKHIPHTSKLSKEGVKVFQASSRGYNVMLQITDQPQPDIDRVAKEYIGKEIYVGWPHLYEAKVVAVCDEQTSFSLVDSPAIKGGKSSEQNVPQVRREACDENTSSTWWREANSITDRYKDRLGVIVGDTHLLLRALPMTGRKYIFGSHGRVTMEKQFGNRPVPFALQTTVKDIAVHDPNFCQFKTLKEYLPEGQPVFMLGWPHYGCQGEVIEVDTESGRVRINLTIFEEPQLDRIMNNQNMHDEPYFPGYIAAQRLGISSSLLGRMTGTVFMMAGEAEVAKEQQNPHKVNIGLNLKFTRRGEEVPGYTKNIDGKWMYSQKTVDTLREYMMKFPEMFQILSSLSESRNNDNYYESEVIPKSCTYNLKTVQEYIKTLDCTSVKSMKSGADIISEGVIKAVEQETNRVVEINKKRQKRVKMQVKPHLLFRHLSTSGALIPDSTTTYRLFDRIVNIRQGYAVPFGLRGIVVGIHPAEVEVNTMYEVIFDEEFLGGIDIRGSSNRGYRMPPSAVLNLTHGERKNGVKPQVTENQAGSNQHRNVASDFSYTTASQGGYNQGNQGNRNMSGPSGYQNNRPGLGYQDYNQGRGGYSRNTDSNRGSDRNQSEWDRGYRNTQQGSDNNYVPPHLRDGYSKGVERQNVGQGGESKQQLRDGYSKMVKRQNEGRGANTNSQPRTDTRVDVSGNVFNGASAGSSHPKFVTPKVSESVPTAKRRSQTEYQSGGPPGKQDIVANSEFESMWKQLQSSQPPSGSSESTQGPSLSQAAAVLPIVPSAGMQPNIETNENKNNAGQATTKIDVQSLFSQASKAGATSQVLGQVVPPKASIAGQGAYKKASVSTEGKPGKGKAGNSKVVSNDEFAAMFKSLAEGVTSDEEDDVNEEAETEAPEDSSILIKKILKIDGQSEHLEVSEKTEPPSGGNKNYGRQLSIQELFDGVKAQQEQQPLDTSPPQQQQNKGNSYEKLKQQGSQGQQQGYPPNPVQPQAYQNQNRPALLIPPSQGGNRNPVMELMSFCQALQMGLPMYDYIPKNGVHYCVVTLITGARFQGSLCKTKEEAAESAASVTLLQLKGSMQQMASQTMMGMPGFVPGIHGEQFSSPNSAFSPVSTFVGQYQGQGARGSYQGYNQRSYNRGQGHQQYNQTAYRYQSSQGSNYYNQQMPTNQNQGRGQSSQNMANQSSLNNKKDEFSTNQKQSKVGSSNQGEVKMQPTCVVTPFVPLQVVKKQTPQKIRKESTSEESSSRAEELPVSGDNFTGASIKGDKLVDKLVDTSKPSAVVSDSCVSASKSADKDNKSTRTSKSADEVISVNKKDPSKVSESQTPEKSGSKTTVAGSAKKPKKRLAANFNFSP